MFSLIFDRTYFHIATLLQTPIDVISVAPAHQPIMYSFRPYPQKDSLPFINPAALKITLWQSQAHYQLLLPQQYIFPSINTGQLLLPRSHINNIKPQSHLLSQFLHPFNITIIPDALSLLPHHPSTPMHFVPAHAMHTAPIITLHSDLSHFYARTH